MSKRGWSAKTIALGGMLGFSTAGFAAPPPSVDQVLTLKPTQRLVEYDSPSADAVAGCKVDVVTEGKATGWTLRDASGRLYRKFTDTNRDNVVDQWSYYQGGVEVYRDIDSNFNGRADQFRWINSGGTRWAIDANEDGKIDSFRVISAEEVAREVFRSLALKDFSMVEPLIVRPNDASALGLAVSADRIKELNRNAKDRFTDLAAQLSHLTAESRWVRFDGTFPMSIPGDAADGSRDVEVYRNAMAVVQTGDKIDVLQFGELVQVGRAWKIVTLPALLPSDGAPIAALGAGLANVPQSVDASGSAEAIDPQVQNLVLELQKVDEASAKLNGDNAATARYHLQRADVLEKLAQRSRTEQDRGDWQRQLADSLIAASQADSSAAASERLNRLSEAVRKENPNSGLLAYIAYRQVSAEYTRLMQAPGSDFAAVQKQWLEQLAQFAAKYPTAEDTPEVLSQLAIGMEFSGKEDDARKYYEKLINDFANSPTAERARGALRRLDLVGKPFVLKASDLRRGTVDTQRLEGKVVLIDYWATWCEPCKADVPRLKEIYDKYHRKGFEIISVSVDSDQDKDAVSKFVKSAGIPWSVVHESGGLDSPPATQYGVISLPTHFLVDAQGKVISRSVTISQLEDELKKLLK